MAKNTHSPSILQSWLQLIRLPNLFTVPGDPMAGFALAAAWIGLAPPLRFLFLGPIVSLLLYSYGLILNDIVDIRADKKNRAGRPLAEGKISLFLALPACVALALLGLLFALLGGELTFWTTVVLAGLITSYNLLLKRFLLLGSVNMGLCRTFSVLVGVSMLQVMAVPAILAAVGIGVYVACVTWIADHEEDFYDFANTAFLPLAGYGGTLLLAGGLSLIASPGERLFLLLVPAALGLLRVALTCKMLAKRAIAPAVTQRSIGSYLRAMIPLQAALLLMGHGLLVVVLALAMVLFLWPAARVLSHRFYAS